MSPTGIQLNKTAAIAIIGVVFTIVLVFTFYRKAPTDNIEMAARNSQTWKPKTFIDVPADAEVDLDKVKVENITIKLTVDGKEFSMFYREASASKPKMHILFLHGQAFKSLTWMDHPMKSLQLLSKLGYRAVAIDLPGYGKSEKAAVDHVNYMEAVMAALKLQTPVIISPSMSGGFSLPFLFKDPVNVLKRAKGFVPVAPVQTDAYSSSQYAMLKIPTMHICGELDSGIGMTARKNLQGLPNYELFVLKDAHHPAYLDRPADFHKYLYNFLLAIEPT